MRIRKSNPWKMISLTLGCINASHNNNTTSSHIIPRGDLAAFYLGAKPGTARRSLSPTCPNLVSAAAMETPGKSTEKTGNTAAAGVPA